MTPLIIKNAQHDTTLQFEPKGKQVLVTMGADMNGQHAMGVSMWLSYDELDRIACWILQCRFQQFNAAITEKRPASKVTFCPNCHCETCRPECHGLTDKQKEPVR